MRILICNFEYPPLGGGGGVATEILARHLAKDHKVVVLTSGGPSLPSEAIENNVRVLRVPVLFSRGRATASIGSMSGYVIMGMRAGRRLLRKTEFDIVNTHFVLPTGPVGQFLASRANIPNVLSVHGGDLYEPAKRMSPHRHFLLRVSVRSLLHSADAVVGQSRNTIDNVHQIYSKEISCERIPLGIERFPVSHARRADFGYTDDETLIITVGRLVPRKAIGSLINIFARIGQDKSRLLILGDGPEMADLQALSRSLGLESCVDFHGFVDEDKKQDLLRISDFFASTSRHEGFGLVFLEAMAAGLPVISYDAGGQVDFLEDRNTGFLVALDNEDEFLERCNYLAARRSEGNLMGKKNEKRVQEFFADRCADRYSRLFERVIGER